MLHLLILPLVLLAGIMQARLKTLLGLSDRDMEMLFDNDDDEAVKEALLQRLGEEQLHPAVFLCTACSSSDSVHQETAVPAASDPAALCHHHHHTTYRHVQVGASAKANKTSRQKTPSGQRALWLFRRLSRSWLQHNTRRIDNLGLLPKKGRWA